jgi:hypothetical protein
MGLPFMRIGFQLGAGIGPLFNAGRSKPSDSNRRIFAPIFSSRATGLITAIGLPRSVIKLPKPAA